MLKKAIPHAKVHMLPGAGHVFTTDATEPALAAMLEFFDEQDAAPQFPHRSCRQHDAGLLSAHRSRDTPAGRGTPRRG